MSFARHVFFMNQIYLININSFPTLFSEKFLFRSKRSMNRTNERIIKKLSRWKEKENKTTKLDMLKEANGWKGDMIMMPPKQNTSSNALT